MRRLLAAATAGLALAAAAPSAAPAATRRCGEVVHGAFSTWKITADGTSCRRARSVARGWPAASGFPHEVRTPVTVRGYRCRTRGTKPVRGITCTRRRAVVRFKLRALE